MSPARLAASGFYDLKHDSEHNDVNYYNLTHSDRCVEFSRQDDRKYSLWFFKSTNGSNVTDSPND